MPVTRSKSTAAITKALASEKIHLGRSTTAPLIKETKPSAKVVKPVASSRKQPSSVPSSPSKASKPRVEQLLSHIVIPVDLEPPQAYIEYHTPNFIEGVRHVLKVDPSLYPVIVHKKFDVFSQADLAPLSDKELISHYWLSLVSSVISQQVSGSAARAIKQRFVELFSTKPTAEETLKIPPETVKAVGLSGMKLKYVIHISEVFSSPSSRLSSADFYRNSSTDELIQELTKLKGIGEWSAKMFALFTLKDMDVFAHDDLGIARGVARYLEARPDVLQEVKNGVHAVQELKDRLKRKSKFHTDKSKRDWTPIHDEYVKFLALRFEPYRSVFMLIMWKLSSTNVEAFTEE